MLETRRPLAPASIGGRPLVVSGLILLVFIGLLIAYFASKGRRRLGLPFRGQTWFVVIAAVVLIGLMLWASSTRH
jgi:hypothetical protein